MPVVLRAAATLDEPNTSARTAFTGPVKRWVDDLAAEEEPGVEHVLLQWAEAYEDSGLVFARENGLPIRPEKLLHDFRSLTEQAGLPQVRIHDLRHLAATLMIGAGVPLALVSTMLRHSKVGITVDLYGHLSRETSTAAADTLRRGPRRGRSGVRRGAFRGGCDHSATTRARRRPADAQRGHRSRRSDGCVSPGQ
jgi:hypothetical protein